MGRSLGWLMLIKRGSSLFWRINIPPAITELSIRMVLSAEIERINTIVCLGKGRSLFSNRVIFCLKAMQILDQITQVIVWKLLVHLIRQLDLITDMHRRHWVKKRKNPTYPFHELLAILYYLFVLKINARIHCIKIIYY